MSDKLKTLKDLTFFFSDRVKLEKEFISWAKKENIKVCPHSVIGWIQDKIRTRNRRAAIKWRKHFEKCRPQIILKDWEDFFNITEEDLK